ncbi:hypothetical protein FF1_017175 [Malus domestica]
MKLVSNPSSNNLSYILQIKYGDLVLSSGYQTPQPYWSMAKEIRKTINKDSGVVTSTTISKNSWKFFDRSKALLWKFIFSSNIDANATWIAVLGSDGFISFYSLQNRGSSVTSASALHVSASVLNCKAGVVSSCDPSRGFTELVNARDGLYYFALGYIPPFSKTDLNGSFQNSDKGSGFVSYIKVSRDGSSGTGGAEAARNASLML